MIILQDKEESKKLASWRKMKREEFDRSKLKFHLSDDFLDLLIEKVDHYGRKRKRTQRKRKI